MADDAHIAVSHLTMAYDDFVIQRNLDFTVRRGEVFIIMGGSGCGKTTLLKHMIGLKAPVEGDVLYDGKSFWTVDEGERNQVKRRFGCTRHSARRRSGTSLPINWHWWASQVSRTTRQAKVLVA